jgi:hypothetical protein
MGVAWSWCAADPLTEVGKELDCFVAIAQRNDGYGSTKHRRASAITALERPQGVLADKMFRSRCAMASAQSSSSLDLWRELTIRYIQRRLFRITLSDRRGFARATARRS